MSYPPTVDVSGHNDEETHAMLDRSTMTQNSGVEEDVELDHTK